jgi:hypothetical protein
MQRRDWSFPAPEPARRDINISAGQDRSAISGKQLQILQLCGAPRLRLIKFDNLIAKNIIKEYIFTTVAHT